MAVEKSLRRDFRRLFLPAALINALLILVVIGGGQYLFVRQTENQSIQRIKAQFNTLAAIDRDQVLMLAKALAANSAVQSAFEMTPSPAQRQSLKSGSASLVGALEHQFGRAAVVFIANRHVLYRSNDPTLYGDTSVPGSGIDHALATRKPVTDFGLMKTGYAISGVAPVLSSTGAPLGVAQVTLPLATLFKVIVANAPGSIAGTVIRAPQGVPAQIQGTRIGDNVLNYASSPALRSYIRTHPDSLTRAISTARLAQGRIYRLVTIPIDGTSGKPLGVAIFGNDMTNTLQTGISVVAISLITSVLVFVAVSLLLLRFVGQRIVNPLSMLSGRIRSISRGERLGEVVQATESNEIGSLQGSAERLRKTLSKLVRHLTDEKA